MMQWQIMTSDRTIGLQDLATKAQWFTEFSWPSSTFYIHTNHTDIKKKNYELCGIKETVTGSLELQTQVAFKLFKSNNEHTKSS
jgi:hypothetical protein